MLTSAKIKNDIDIKNTLIYYICQNDQGGELFSDNFYPEFSYLSLADVYMLILWHKMLNNGKIFLCSSIL